ncbi:hypothetical protein [Coraliomargarita akajimensis]|nr:hypothetical protein [Coraliomargarita akajimensis]
MKKLLLLSCLLFTAGSAYAVKVKSGYYKNKAMFGIKVEGDCCGFLAKEAAVRSVSMQKYITNGFKVHELNIVTDGNGLLRIYHSRPLEPGELASALNRVTSSVSNGTVATPNVPERANTLVERASETYDVITDTIVIKEYPNATHAHTIELRTSSRDELIELFEKIESHWLQQDDEEDGVEDNSEGNVTIRQGRKRLGGSLFILEK